MPLEFIARNGIIASNNSLVSGSLTVTQGITGSLQGTATTASYVLSSSYATTSSYADNFTVGNTLTAQRIVVQTISSSVVYASGSNRFGNDITNTQSFTGSVGITGSLTVGASRLLLYADTPPSANSPTKMGYMFSTIGTPGSNPAGSFIEDTGNGTILSYGVNVPQAGARNISYAGGIFRLDTRVGAQEFNILAFPSGSSGEVGRLSISLQNGNTTLVASGGNVSVGNVGAGSKLQVSGNTAIGYSSTTAAPSNGLTISGSTLIGTTIDSGYKLDVNGTFRQSGSVTAASALAAGSTITPTLIASANSDVLVGLDINPTFTNGAFTGVTNTALRVNGAILNSGGLPSIGTASFPFGTFFIVNVRAGGDLSLGSGFASSGDKGLLMYSSTRNITLQNGGTFTDAGYRLDVTGTTRLNGTTTIVSASLDYQQNLAVATGSFQTIVSAATGSFRSAFFDYVAFSGSIVRAGTLVSTWSGSVTEYFENFTGDLGGSTAVVTLQTAISGSNIQLQAGISGSAWAVRSLVRLL